MVNMMRQSWPDLFNGKKKKPSITQSLFRTSNENNLIYDNFMNENEGLF